MLSLIFGISCLGNKLHVDFDTSPDNVRNAGFYCLNADNRPRGCADYKVWYFCPTGTTDCVSESEARMELIADELKADVDCAIGGKSKNGAKKAKIDKRENKGLSLLKTLLRLKENSAQ